MSRFTLVFAAAVLAIAIAAPSGFAQEAIPPGNSGADQYGEGVPGGGGNNSSTGSFTGSAGSSGRGGQGLPQGTVKQLQEAGPSGAAAVAALGSTVPSGTATPSTSANGQPGASGQPGAGGQAEGGQPGDGGSSGRGGDGTLRNLADSVLGTGSDGGMGAALPILLGVVLAGAVAIVARRRMGEQHLGSSSS